MQGEEYFVKVIQHMLNRECKTTQQLDEVFQHGLQQVGEHCCVGKQTCPVFRNYSHYALIASPDTQQTLPTMNVLFRY